MIWRKVAALNSMQSAGRDYLSDREAAAVSKLLSAKIHHDTPRSRQVNSRRYVSQDKMIKLWTGSDNLLPVLNQSMLTTQKIGHT